ncbi:hypothetical protein [Cupriavidus taiwanensis]|nr:hypothetical protein [Cupriavidus taiwanensis]
MAEKLALLGVLIFFCLIFFIAGYVLGYEARAHSPANANDKGK